MSEYIETTEDVREGYVEGTGFGEEVYAQFDRWYAEEIRKAKEEAWGECDQETLTHIETNGTQTENWPENPYRKETE